VGSDQWKESRLDSRFGIDGDFDISVDLQVKAVQKPTARAHSGAYLTALFDTDRYHRVDIHTVFHQDGHEEIGVVEATEDDSGKRKSDVRGSVRILATEVCSLRMMRQGQTMSFYFVNAKGKSHEVAKSQVGTAAVAFRG
jgi:hypothetical protein